MKRIAPVHPRAAIRHDTARLALGGHAIALGLCRCFFSGDLTIADACFAPKDAVARPKSTVSHILMGLLLAASITACVPSDTVTSRYGNLAEARADRLFERGWLPDILPPSAHAIRTTNDLDHNTSQGEFSFSPSHSDRLYERFTPGAPDKPAFDDWAGTVANYARRGYSAWSYRKDAETWAFFCTPNKDRCEYFL